MLLRGGVSARTWRNETPLGDPGAALLDRYDRSLRVLARWALESMLFMIRLFGLDPRKQHYCPAFRAGRTKTGIGLRRGRLKMCHGTPPGSKRLSRMGCPFIVY